MEKSENNQTLNVIFVGAPQVGKSCVVHGYKFEYDSNTKVSSVKKEYKIQDRIVKFELWDIPATEILKNTNLDVCKKGEIVALVYAVNDKKSFNQCQTLVQRMVDENRVRYNAKFALVSNKNDLEKCVPSSQEQEASNIISGTSSLDIPKNLFEVSAKNGGNILQQLCKGFYLIWKSKNIKNISEIVGQDTPAQAQPIISLEISKPPLANVSKPYKDYACRVLILGQAQTGKTAILQRFADDFYPETYTYTIGVDFRSRCISIQGCPIKLLIFECGGMQMFKPIKVNYIKGNQVILIVYDCSNLQSFFNLDKQVQLIKNHLPTYEQSVIYIVANKIDKQNLVSMQQGKNYAQSLGYEFAQVSALNNTGVTQLFTQATEKWINKMDIINSQQQAYVL